MVRLQRLHGEWRFPLVFVPTAAAGLPLSAATPGRVECKATAVTTSDCLCASAQTAALPAQSQGCDSQHAVSTHRHPRTALLTSFCGPEREGGNACHCPPWRGMLAAGTSCAGPSLSDKIRWEAGDVGCFVILSVFSGDRQVPCPALALGHLSCSCQAVHSNSCVHWRAAVPPSKWTSHVSHLQRDHTLASGAHWADAPQYMASTCAVDTRVHAHNAQ